MCGIVGYIGHRDAWPTIVDGLQRLEYRGYDSVGVGVLTASNQLTFHKSVGKVHELMPSVKDGYPTGTVGVGHTRWATHGSPTLQNAHPHTDCHQQVAVVHNGIVENHLTLKRDLLDRGHVFRSETDSEIIAHLLEENLQQGLSFEEALAQVGPLLEGAQAIVALSAESPNKLLAMRLGNAGGIVIAHGDNETIIASDLPAVLPITNRVVFLDDGDIGIVTRDGVDIINSIGTKITPKESKISVDNIDINKEGYSHFMLKEMMEQPQAVSSALRERVNFDTGTVEFADFPLSMTQIQALKRVTLIGCGTSFHAAMVGKTLIETLAGIQATAEISSEFRYQDLIIDPHTLVIAIAQSGETADTLAAMKEAQNMGAPLITICNAEGSQATRLADTTLYMRSNIEVGVCSTKTFVASLTILYLIAIYLGQARDSTNKDNLKTLVGELARVPNLLGKILADHSPYTDLADLMGNYPHLLYIGRGITFPVATEGALKMKEISYIHAEGYPAGELKHGPIALIGPEIAVVAIAPKTSLYPKMANAIMEVKARDGLVLAIATENDTELASTVDHVIYIPTCSELLTPLLTTIPLQLLAYYVAVKRGCDVDQPRNLAKSVTVE